MKMRKGVISIKFYSDDVKSVWRNAALSVKVWVIMIGATVNFRVLTVGCPRRSNAREMTYNIGK